MAEQKTQNKPEHKVPEHKAPVKVDDNFRHFIRIANTDLNGNYSIERSLSHIKGISYQFAHAICYSLNIDGNQKTGYVDEHLIRRIEELIKDPLKFKIPVWMLNRRKDPETGENIHLLTSNLDFVKDNDIKMMKKLRSYKGIRHMSSLPVRGQRTKAHFRKNKGKISLGVKRRPGAKTGKV